MGEVEINTVEQLIASTLDMDERATNGPWTYIERKGFPTITGEGFRGIQSEPFFDVSGNADALLCAHYRTAAPRLAKVCEILWNANKLIADPNFNISDMSRWSLAKRAQDDCLGLLQDGHQR